MAMRWLVLLALVVGVAGGCGVAEPQKGEFLFATKAELLGADGVIAAADVAEEVDAAAQGGTDAAADADAMAEADLGADGDANEDALPDVAPDAVPDVAAVVDADDAEASGDDGAGDGEVAAEVAPDVPLPPVCTSTEACGDGNPCTDDVCEAAVGCKHVDNTAGCDDGSACTVADGCKGGVCLAGAVTVCDDGNGCTDDGCDKGAGCVSAANAATWTDGDACTGGEGC